MRKGNRLSGDVVQLILLLFIALALGTADQMGWLFPVKRMTDVVVMPMQVQVRKFKTELVKRVDFLTAAEKKEVEIVNLRRMASEGLVDEVERRLLLEENQSLKNLLGIMPSASKKMLLANVVRQDGNGYWINVGSRHKVMIGMLVLEKGILWGRIDEVEYQQSHLVTLDSEGHEWSVEVKNEGREPAQGILSFHDNKLEMRGLLTTDLVNPGDLIITRGDQGLLPGVPVGKVFSLSVPDETALYQFAQVAWPIDSMNVTQVEVLIEW